MKRPSYKSYDYIIAGVGCAGLSLAMHLKKSKVKFERVLLIDKASKNTNDRTWCFWTKENDNWFDPIVFRKWDQFQFKSPDIHRRFSLNPYTYRMIRGIDFYNHCLAELRADKRFEFVEEEIKTISCDTDFAFLSTTETTYSADYIFNSAFFSKNTKPGEADLVQHFKGWVIKTADDHFDEDCPMFMDFTIDQESDCRFVYTIPYSTNTALVEYTGFSKTAIEDHEYDERLKSYIDKITYGDEYQILEQEKGSIPMTESKFINPYGKRVVNIGTAGGTSKASTGYTFYFIQKHCEQIIDRLKKKKSPAEINRHVRFSLYDKIFLDVLNEKRVAPEKLFTQLFETDSIENLLAFLNEESDLKQEFGIINSLDKKPFLAAAFKKINLK